MGQEIEVPLTSGQVDRRWHVRYQLCEPLLIRRKDGSCHQAATSEISMSGLSAATAGILRPGEEVHLSPVVGAQVSAIVRRKIGTMYGFEFISVPPQVKDEIRILCRGLAPFPGLSKAQGS